MGTIEDKLRYLNTTKIKLKDSINLTGANITNDTTFRNYSVKLKESLVNILKGNIWDLFDNFDTVEGTGENFSLNNTYDDTIMKIDLKGNTKQDIIEADEGITLSDTLIYTNNINTEKEHTIELSGNTYQDVIMEEEGTKVSNTKIYVNDVNTDKESSIEMSGNTYQETTIGKNLLYVGTTRTEHSVTCTYDKSTGIYNVTGTSDYTGNTNLTSNVPLVLPSGTYTLSIDHALDSQIYIHAHNPTTDSFTNVVIDSGNTSGTNTFEYGMDYYNLRLGVTNGATYNLQFKLQLESGSTATDWEKFTNGPSPNPDYPQNIEVVTGEQNIKIEGKNKCDYISNIIASAQGLTNTINSDGSITTTGKPTSNYTKITQVINIIDNLKDNTYYTISQSASSYYLFIQMNIRSKSGTYTYLNAKTGSASFLVDKSQYDKYEITIQTTTTSTWGSSSRTITNSYQLEEGQTATAFEPYHLQSYLVNLGKNLFNPQYEVETQYKTDGSTITSKYNLSSGAITIADSDAQAGRYFFNKLFLGAGTYTLSWTPSVSGTNKKMNYSVRNLNSLTDIVVDTRIDIVDGTRQNISFTLNEDQSVSFSLQPAAADSGTLTLEDIQLEKGITATTYAEYFTPIELCKIDTYQDKIYKEKEKWYLEKKVNKIFLTGNENLFRTGTSTTGYYRFTMDIGDNIYTTDAPTDIAPFYCNKFIPGSRVNSYGLIDCVYPSTPSFSYKSFGFYCKETKEMTVEQCQTWLSQKDIVVYYPYATPIKTEITNSTLINQLETLYNADLYSAVDIETQTDNLLPYIDLHYNFVFPEPTPDTPKNIDITTGAQNINITGKNLLPYPYTETTHTSNGVTFTVNNDGTILVNGTATGGNANIKLYGNYQEQNQLKFPGKYLYGGTTNVWLRALNNHGGNYSLLGNDTGEGVEIDTTTYDIGYIELTIKNGTTVNNATIKPMILNSLDDTTYEPYINTTYPINLGKNLFDKDSAMVLDNYYIGGNGSFIAGEGYHSIYLPCESNTTYTISWGSINPTSQNRCRIATCDSTITTSSTLTILFNGSNTQYHSPQTITTPSDAKYIVLDLIASSATTTVSQLMSGIQVEKGPTATDYAPYFEPIELCKIGAYQDKIYKSNNKWFLYKTIDKIILDGSENWDKSNVAGNTKTQRFSFSMAKAHVNDVGFCKQFIVKTSDTSVYSDKELFQLTSSASNKYTAIQINIDRLSENTVEVFKTWLSNNNVTLYYVLNTPTTTEITDTNLVNQLNALYNATIYPITNINTDTSNLLPYIDLHYNFVTPSPSPSRPSQVSVVTGNNNIKVVGKNLFDKDSEDIGRVYSSTGSYGISRVWNTSDWIKASDYITISASTTESINMLLSEFDNSKTFIQRTQQRGTSKTYNLKTNTKYVRLSYKNDIGITNIQIEKGSTSTTYESYQSQSYPINLEDMELCKIGTYQDYIYESNGNWFKKGNIGKVVLNGSEIWQYISVTQGSLLRNNKIITNAKNDKTYIPYSNNYKGINENSYQSRQNNQFYIQAQNDFLDIIDNRYTTANDFKTWLSTHNTTVYYVLATSTDTQITDTTLITQLNNIKNNARSYDNQTNITQENTNAPFIIIAEAIDKTKI